MEGTFQNSPCSLGGRGRVPGQGISRIGYWGMVSLVQERSEVPAGRRREAKQLAVVPTVAILSAGEKSKKSSKKSSKKA